MVASLRGAHYTGTLTQRAEIGGMAAILTATALLLGYQAHRLALTADEPSHILSSYLYWHGRDRLPPRDMPPLIKLVAGWVPRLYELPVPADLGTPGDRRHEWPSGFTMIEKMARPLVGEVTFRTRLPMIVFPLMTAIVLWRWARAVFTPAAGLAVAALFALEPTALGHGALVKNDHAATFTYLLFWFCAWRWWRKPVRQLAIILGLAAGAAALAKLSMLILVPVALLLTAWRGIGGGARWWESVEGLALVLAVPYVLILAAYGFEAHPVLPDELEALAATAPPAPVLFAARLFQYLPAADGMWEGVAAVLKYSTASKTFYMLGQIHTEGSPWYLPLAVGVKSTVTVMALFAAGLLALGRRGPARAWLWLLPLALYGGIASLSNLQLGLRLFLPVLPFALLTCGAALEWLRASVHRLAPAAVVGLTALESLTVYPHGIAFFNAAAGGPAAGLRYLADSNIDWGQGLSELPDALRRTGIPRVKLFYFGGDTPHRFLKDEQFERQAPPWSAEWAKGPRFQPEPGDYAISATLLPGHLFLPEYRDYFAVFRGMEPVTRAGNSIYVYRVGRGR